MPGPVQSGCRCALSIDVHGNGGESRVAAADVLGAGFLWAFVLTSGVSYFEALRNLSVFRHKF